MPWWLPVSAAILPYQVRQRGREPRFLQLAWPVCPGVYQLDPKESEAGENGKRIVREALEAFKARQDNSAPTSVEAPRALTGFSYSSILAALAELNPADPLQFLLENMTVRLI